MRVRWVLGDLLAATGAAWDDGVLPLWLLPVRLTIKQTLPSLTSILF